MTEQVRLCLKWNNTAVGGPCPVCGERDKPDIGMTVFLEGTGEPVCDECARRLNPVLLVARNAANDDHRTWAAVEQLSRPTG
jgi:hypothetical protein